MSAVRHLAMACLAGVLLAGCAVPQWLEPGTPLQTVEQSMGRPTQTEALAEGGVRLLYSRQPAGQQVYHIDFDGHHRLVSVAQVLSEASFQRLQPGVDTRASVQAFFGPPALVERVARFDGDIWTYRLMENLTPRLAHVHIDPSGVVRRVMFTDEILGEPDPRR